MAFIGAGELASMRAAADGLLGSRCTVRARSIGIDSIGGETVTWTETTNVPCKLAAIVVKNQSTEGDRFNVHAGWVLSVRHDQALASGDEITMGGETYIVLAAEDAATWRVVRRYYLRRVD